MKSNRRGVSLTIGLLAILAVGLLVGAVAYYDGTSSGPTAWTSLVMKTVTGSTTTVTTTVAVDLSTTTTTTTVGGSTTTVTVTSTSPA
jgi:uncharacterized protein (UPF0333 family)